MTIDRLLSVPPGFSSVAQYAPSSLVRGFCQSLLLASLFSMSIGCSESPVAGDRQDLVIVDGLTASLSGLDVTLTKYNSSWFPTDDSPRPASDEVFMTFLVEVRNRSDGPRSVSVDDFLLRTLISGELHEGPTWEAFAQGRTPQLQDVSVLPGQATRKWLTYSIPRTLYAEELLWRPQEGDVVFAIGLSGGSFGRVGQALVFGRVTDPDGSPISNFSLVVTPVETVPGIVGVDSVIGKCRGTPHDPRETGTDELGWYRDTVSTVHGDEFCIDVHPMSSSEIESRSAGYVKPRIPSPIEEIPEVRIDLKLGSTNSSQDGAGE